MADIPPGVDVFETAQASLHAANFATFSVACVAVGLRFGSRWISQQRRWCDDWMILGALAISFFLVLDMNAWIHSGFGRHYELYGPSVFPIFFQHLMFADIFYAMIQVFVKISMLFFYVRNFESPGIRLPMAYMGMFLGCWLVAAIITASLQCDPSAAECGIASRGYPFGIWVPNMVMNVLIVVLPLRFIERSRLPRTQQKLLCAVFGMGAVVCAVSAIRLVSLLAQDSENLDFTWNLVSFGVWTLIESNVAIVAACLPTFKPVWNANEHFYSNSSSRRNSAFSETIEEKFQPAWLDEHGPLTPPSPETPGTSARPYRDSDDRESGMTTVELDDED